MSIKLKKKKRIFSKIIGKFNIRLSRYSIRNETRISNYVLKKEKGVVPIVRFTRSRTRARDPYLRISSHNYFY